MNFKLKKPCSNCPFRKVGAIELREGRLDSIIANLQQDDYSVFHCHKTVHSKRGGEWKEDGAYVPSGNESVCMGAVAYQWRDGNMAVAIRFALAVGLLSTKEIKAVLPHIIERRPALQPTRVARRKSLK